MERAIRNRWLLLTGSMLIGALFALSIQRNRNKRKAIRGSAKKYDYSANPHGTDYFFSGEEESVDLAVANRELLF